MKPLAVARRAPGMACCALLALALPARAQSGDSTSISASLRLDYFSASRDLNGTDNLFGANGEFKFKHAFSSSQRVEAEVRISRNDLTRDGDDDVRWLGAYWFFRSGPVAVWLGQQKIRWGKADGLNPSDFFTPIDYTVALPLEADRYQAIPALRTDIAIGEIDTLSIVVEPHFTASRFPWPDAIPVEVTDDKPSGVERPQLGLRWLRTGETVDWSLSGFSGYSTLPVLNFAGVSPDGVAQYQRYYPRSEGLGADVARNFGQWGFRAEIAYSAYHDDDRQAIASSYFLVSGVDRTLGDWNFNLQALYRYTPDFEKTHAAAGAGQEFSATQNAIVYNQPDRGTPGMTARVGAEWLHGTLKAEVLYLAFFGPTNSLLRPLLSYALSDTRKLLLGGEYYSGRDESFFGAFKQDRTVFVEFQQFF
jgi:hypothetical protein